ncbi:MAG: NifB/NifX family molybdenum-iron cluster-binding protein [Candidatus Bipolaricaulota bacterium]
MLICITAQGSGLDAAVDPTFGRAKYFVFADSETLSMDAVENAPGAHGAGVQAAQRVADKRAAAVVTGNVGPNAFQGLAAAGVAVYVGASGTVREAIEAFREGRLQRAEGPSGRGHRGGL